MNEKEAADINLISDSKAGLPDGLFSNQKSKFG
jgi:hypothetical protein